MAIDIDHVLDEVATAEGLDDYGHPSYREALQRFVASAVDEAQLTPMGSAALEGAVRASLRNRLRVTGWHAQDPDLARTPVEAPIFIVGLSRTGTTALSHLLRGTRRTGRC